MTLGRFDEALDERRRALEIDPLTPMLSVGLAELHNAMRRPDLALDAVERTLERNPRFWCGAPGPRAGARAAWPSPRGAAGVRRGGTCGPGQCPGDVLRRGRARGDRTSSRSAKTRGGNRTAGAFHVRSSLRAGFDARRARRYRPRVRLASAELRYEGTPPHGDRLPPRESTRSVRTRASPSSWRASGCRSAPRPPADPMADLRFRARRCVLAGRPAEDRARSRKSPASSR